MACRYFWRQAALRNFFCRSIHIGSTSIPRPRPKHCCIIVRKLSSSCSSITTKSRKFSTFGMFPCYRSDCNPFLSRPVNRRLLLAIREFGKSSKKSSAYGSLSEKHSTTAMYVISIVILVCGGSYAAVPLYRLYCQVRILHAAKVKS